MNRTFKKLLTIAGSVSIALVAVAQLPEDEGLALCNCPDGLKIASELPMSHPINRCAAGNVTASEVSWSSWFTGHSSTSQLHYLDLLELLSRHSQSSSTQSNH